MADRKDRFALITRFEKLCKMKGMSAPTINKYNEQWAADALLESFDIDELYRAMEYYLSIQERSTWKVFANNAGRLLESMKASKEDREFRAEMRHKAKEWVSG
jgi:hypothetical protein